MKKKEILTLALAFALTLGMGVAAASYSAQALGRDDTGVGILQQNADENALLQISDAVSNIANENARLRVAWWGNQERNNTTIEVLDEYAALTGAKLTYEYTVWTGYVENLMTQAAGNNLPDLIQISTTDLVDFSRSGQLLDLQSYIDSGVIDTTGISGDALSGGVVDGVLTGFSTGLNTVSVVYNQAVFEEAGVDAPADDWTWSDYLKTVKTIYEATGIPSDIPFLTEARWVLESMVRSYGYEFFSTEGDSDGGLLPWAEDETVIAGLTDVLSDIYDGIQEGFFIDPETQMSWSATEDYYIIQGKSAASFILNNYYTTYCYAFGDELGLAMLPKMDDGTESGMYALPSMYWCISAGCEDPEAAASLINYLINDTDAALTIGMDRGVSLSSEIRSAFFASEDTDVYTKNVFAFVDHVSETVSAVTPPDPENSAEVIEVMKEAYQSMMYGELSVEEGIAQILESSR
ncbi:MAG: extracellular solute-binding protein [Lachnospiraceae bacterium]|nr:extracellular solute-binding protein [Lachnospiraceae bacterium]